MSASKGWPGPDNLAVAARLRGFRDGRVWQYGGYGEGNVHVVREAVREYEMRTPKLNGEERERMLATVDRMVHEPLTRTAAEVDAELGEIRASRRRWGRRRAIRRSR